LAEFAVAAPIIIVLLFGILEFGVAFYTKGLITNASREGARFGVVFTTPRKTGAQIQSKVNEFLVKAGFTQTTATSVTGAGGATGSLLTVNVSYPYNFQVLPHFVQGFTGSITLRAVTAMRME